MLLHLTSLPGPHGSGDLGAAAHAFVEFLADAGQTWWQMLPVGPPGPGNSPYASPSAIAGSPWLISLDVLQSQGLLSRADLRPSGDLRDARVNYRASLAFRAARLRRAYAAWVHSGGPRGLAFIRFCRAQHGWLDDYALFAALQREQSGQSWIDWPSALRDRRPDALRAARRRLADELRYECFLQYEFDHQWSALKQHAGNRGVGLIGDIPIFVGRDSADVWAHRPLFSLQRDGRPRLQSGVPPDLFTRDGQLWGHPLYHWPHHRRTGFAWWVERFRAALRWFDGVRIDHFLGFSRCWAVAGHAKTARRGRWSPSPGGELFRAVRRALGPLNIIAEDLGILTPAAVALRDGCGFPGMRVLQCAFGEGEGGRYHQPHRYPPDCVAYTATHDFDTTVGWFNAARRRGPRVGADGLREWERALRYLGGAPADVPASMLRALLASPARTAIFPLQDALGLDGRARMNLPGSPTGNWEWRARAAQLDPGLARRLRELTIAYERAAPLARRRR